ncbi:MASE4 domain-containing protein [Nocardioides sp. GY 10127]|uniref:sensor histidine kinase n=1 Tax=Nocardioides sp. GY 10127 TaxID=2569762 RepID=UPI0010A8E9CC|nr:MASE4 domain-containing protein [Nocardioides sp. GY 10127]TIC78930.1 hypothetical protein E8D37_18820 [Nocardioides sp. GY 10127]
MPTSALSSRLPAERVGRAPWVLVGLVAVVTALVLVNAQHPLGQNAGFLPAFLALVVLSDAMTGVVLIALYATGGNPRYLALSWAYAYSSGVVVVHAAVFPNVFAPAGALGSTPDSAPWLWTAWHVGFPLLLLAGIVPWPGRFAAWASGRRRLRKVVLTHLGVAVLVVGVAVTCTAFADRLPVIIDETGSYHRLTVDYGPAVLAVQAAAIVAAVVSLRGRTGLERWALVALVATGGDALVVLLAEGRWTVGWYGARIMALTASFVVLVALATESIRQARAVREYAQRMLERNAELREAQALRDHMIAVVSHDMRTPLGGVSGYLELLEAGDLGPLREDGQMAVARARTLIKRVSLLSEDLLTAASGGVQHLTISPRVLDLGREAEQAVAGFPDLDVQLDVVHDPRVRADSLRVQQVLANLLVNAAKYGAEPVRVVVDTDGRDALVSVSDAGPGVPEDFVPHLFERYSRAPGVQANGSGLGLSVVADILDAQGGSVAYRPEGNAFEVRLPLLGG